MYSIIISLLSQSAFAQDAECNLTVTVTCADCEAGQKFPAELYTFATDGTSRYVLDHATMESGGELSGKASHPRRLLSVYGQDLGSWYCTRDGSVTANITNLDLGLHSLRPDPSLVVEEEPDRDTEEDEFEFEPEPPPPPPRAEPVYRAPAVPPDPEPVPLPDPPAREDEEDAVVPYNVGWAAPGDAPIWVGNPGDYPGRGPGKSGSFLDPAITHCPAGKIPVVMGTADAIAGGHVSQVALDDKRASAVAPPDWNGEYVMHTGTVIEGRGAAAIYCAEPGTITRSSPPPVPVAAVAPPLPAPPGVTPADLKAMEDRLREELTPPEPEEEPMVEPPPPVTSSHPFKFIERYGPFGALIRNESEEGDLLYVHGMAGFFITFNLWPDRIGLEPYIAVGGDGESTHPCSYNEQGELTWCSGWYPSIYWGARVPVRLVNVWKFQLHAFAGVGVVQDDINEGFHTWGQMTQYTGGLEVRFMGFKRFKPAFSLEVGGSSVSFLNGSLTHTTGSAWEISPSLKVGF